LNQSCNKYGYIKLNECLLWNYYTCSLISPELIVQMYVFIIIHVVLPSVPFQLLHYTLSSSLNLVNWRAAFKFLAQVFWKTVSYVMIVPVSEKQMTKQVGKCTPLEYTFFKCIRFYFVSLWSWCSFITGSHLLLQT
jgi:hypothetical protein